VKDRRPPLLSALLLGACLLFLWPFIIAWRLASRSSRRFERPCVGRIHVTVHRHFQGGHEAAGVLEEAQHGGDGRAHGGVLESAAVPKDVHRDEADRGNRL
jgi:hypothetical protein